MEEHVYTKNEDDATLAEDLKIVGNDDKSIAEILGISVNLLRHHYGSILDNAQDKFKVEIYRGLRQAAKSGQPTALVYLGKSVLGWSEDVVQSLTIPQLQIGAVEGLDVSEQGLEDLKDDLVKGGRLIQGEVIEGAKIATTVEYEEIDEDDDAAVIARLNGSE